MYIGMKEEEMREKPKVGQTVYRLNIGNAAIRQEQVLTPVMVTKVGRKYFTCAEEGRRPGTEYRIDNGIEKTEYSANSRIYESIKEWEDEKEAGNTYRAIKEKFFSSYGNSPITLENLRKIKKILEPSDD